MFAKQGLRPHQLKKVLEAHTLLLLLLLLRHLPPPRTSISTTTTTATTTTATATATATAAATATATTNISIYLDVGLSPGRNLEPGETGPLALALQIHPSPWPFGRGVEGRATPRAGASSLADAEVRGPG